MGPSVDITVRELMSDNVVSIEPDTLLPETTPHGAFILAGRIVEGLAEFKIPHPDSPLSVITMSCGVACQTTEPAHASWHDVVSLADKALYAAKHSGRNRAHNSNT